MTFLHSVFTVIKFLFGLGALGILMGIGLVFLWFVLLMIVRASLKHQPTERYPRLRQVFLESVP